MKNELNTPNSLLLYRKNSVEPQKSETPNKHFPQISLLNVSQVKISKPKIHENHIRKFVNLSVKMPKTCKEINIKPIIKQIKVKTINSFENYCCKLMMKRKSCDTKSRNSDIYSSNTYENIKSGFKTTQRAGRRNIFSLNPSSKKNPDLLSNYELELLSSYVNMIGIENSKLKTPTKPKEKIKKKIDVSLILGPPHNRENQKLVNKILYAKPEKTPIFYKRANPFSISKFALYSKDERKFSLRNSHNKSVNLSIN